MTLISVLVSLFLDRILFFHRDSSAGTWFGRTAEALARRLPADWNGVGGVLVVVMPPTIVMAVLQWGAAHLLFGLAGLLLGIAVLLFALGPLDIVNMTEDYIDARQADDAERTAWYFERSTGEAPPATPQEEGRRMAAAVLYQGHDNLFATVFWFCVLGPMGAVLYRMAAELALHPGPTLVARPALLRAARHVVGVLGWIPTRLIAFGYAMTGSFEEALGRLRRGFHISDDVLESNRQLLVDAGTAALRQGEDGRGAAEEEPIGLDVERRSDDAAGVVDQARALAQRTAVLWLAVLALLTLGGWFG